MTTQDFLLKKPSFFKALFLWEKSNFVELYNVCKMYIPGTAYYEFEKKYRRTQERIIELHNHLTIRFKNKKENFISKIPIDETFKFEYKEKNRNFDVRDGDFPESIKEAAKDERLSNFKYSEQTLEHIKKLKDKPLDEFEQGMRQIHDDLLAVGEIDKTRHTNLNNILETEIMHIRAANDVKLQEAEKVKQEVANLEKDEETLEKNQKTD